MASASLDSLKKELDQACIALEKKLSSLRTGRADPALLENLTVEVYGGRMPLSQVASVSVLQSQLLSVQVWDGSNASSVEKTLRSHGFCPQMEGQNLRVPLPALTQERRQEFVKMAKKYGEEAFQGIRNIRRKFIQDKNEELSEDEERKYKDNVSKEIKNIEKKMEDSLKKKEKEIIEN